ncbi:hypothetical protein GCM10017771_51760 [Streptomyces capitiformicae]|uniref:Uncharacterized protein n=1 Tax=Streptomyces capitiformicae TaxID=2014920 RepID=A0A918Z1X6_9ACTN|nr:hypothetical protein GCM10017771_51760 [Streptomyces capitiformicae]
MGRPVVKDPLGGQLGRPLHLAASPCGVSNENAAPRASGEASLLALKPWSRLSELSRVPIRINEASRRRASKWLQKTAR